MSKGNVDVDNRPKDLSSIIFVEKEESRRTNALPTIHPVVKINIGDKIVDVDEVIAPIVEWLNSLPGVKTAWSCQGDITPLQKPPDFPRQGGYQSSYVIYYCDNLDSLKIILDVFNEYAEMKRINSIGWFYHAIETKVEVFDGEIRYRSRWHDNLALQDFMVFFKELNGAKTRDNRLLHA